MAPTVIEPAEVIRRCREIVQDAGRANDVTAAGNFLDFADVVRDIMLEWPRDKLAKAKDFVSALRQMRDNFDRLVAADPMILYRPQHSGIEEFHKSPALIRYIRAPNRTSKTQGALADLYFVMTGSHPYLPNPPRPASCAIVVVNFATNANAVFVPKLIIGESGNALSPMFPEHGKWFNRYDERKHILYLACDECAAAGKPGKCRHTRGTLRMFSNEEDLTAFAGGQYGRWLFDEQVDERFLPEGVKRLETVPNSGGIVSETPLGGKGFWTHRILTAKAKAGEKVAGTGRRLVSLHTWTQYEAGLTPAATIDASKAFMTEQEAEARIYGRPAAYSKSAVFNNEQIGEMLNHVRAPARGAIVIVRPNAAYLMPEGRQFAELEDGSNVNDLLIDIDERAEVRFLEDPDGALRVWQMPVPFGQYVIGADVAQGLTDGDASCAQVLRMQRHGLGIRLALVASLHLWVNSLEYAPLLYKLSLFYNRALLLPERRGTGDATILRLRELSCQSLYRDIADLAQVEFQADARFGLDTNVQTKAVFVSTLQNVIWSKQRKERSIDIWDEDTLEELGAYGQEKTPSGQSIRFRGEGGTHDDRVMGLALACYGALTLPIYDMEIEAQEKAAGGPKLTQDDKDFWRSVHQRLAAGAAAREM